MDRKYLLAFSFAVVAVAISSACSPKFTTCGDRGNCTAGASGSGGAGASNHQDGSSGKADHDREDVSAGEGGESGSGGEGGAVDDVPVLFGPCSTKGASACEDHAS